MSHYENYSLAAMKLITADLDNAIHAIRQWDCDYCGAGPGEWCRNQITGLPYGDRVPGHPCRIRKATAA